MRIVVAWVVLGLLLAACGEEPKGAPSAPPSAPPSAGGGTSMTSAEFAAREAEGAAVATDILASFTAAVDEVAALLKDKPAPADALPKVQAVLGRQVEAGKALRERFLALPTGPALQTANRTLSERRPPAVFRKDQLLGTLVFHYRYEQASPELVDVIEKQLVGLIDAAIAPR